MVMIKLVTERKILIANHPVALMIRVSLRVVIEREEVGSGFANDGYHRFRATVRYGYQTQVADQVVGLAPAQIR